MRQWLSPALTAIYFLLPVLEAQRIQMKPKVWGVVGQEEVILPCSFVPGPKVGSVTQVQWNLKANSTEKDTRLIVHDVRSGETNIPNSQYLDKLALKEYSLVIKNVDVDDTGVYECVLSTFPSGTFADTTRLFIGDQMPVQSLSAGVVSAIVISVFLLLGIIAASVYFIVIRRCPPSPRNQVTIDTDGWDPSRPSFIKRDDQVVYSDVAVRQPSNQNRVNTSEDQVTYSEVRVSRTTPEEPLYSRVMKI